MSFLELAKKRYSVRKFMDKPVAKETVLKVLEAGRVAPSAHNKQPWHFIVIQDEEMRKKVAECYNRDWIQAAPVLIVACGDHKVAWHRDDGKDHCDIDLAIAVDHIILQAADLGLGSCWVCAFDAVKCKEVLSLPPELEPIVIIPLGYPAGESAPERHSSRRKSLEEIVHWGGLNCK